MTKSNQGQYQGQYQGQPQVVYVQQKGNSHGCLIFSLVLMFFAWIPGIIALTTLATWKLTKFVWRWTVEVGFKATVKAIAWSWAACVALCVWSYKGSRAGTLWTVARVRALVAARRNAA